MKASRPQNENNKQREKVTMITRRIIRIWSQLIPWRLQSIQYYTYGGSSKNIPVVWRFKTLLRVGV